MTTTQDKLIKKIVEILADYKFNSTQIETAEMTAERIINIVNQKATADFINDEIKWLKDNLYKFDDKLTGHIYAIEKHRVENRIEKLKQMLVEKQNETKR